MLIPKTLLSIIRWFCTNITWSSASVHSIFFTEFLMIDTKSSFLQMKLNWRDSISIRFFFIWMANHFRAFITLYKLFLSNSSQIIMQRENVLCTFIVILHHSHLKSDQLCMVRHWCWPKRLMISINGSHLTKSST